MLHMPYLEHHQAHLWYQDTGGDGAAVVFVHAFSGNADAWTPQTPAFTASGYRCITYDRRGWGEGGHDLHWYCTGDPAAQEGQELREARLQQEGASNG